MSLRAGRVRGCLNIAPRAVLVRALTPPGTVDPPEPLFSEAMIQVKGTYGRARPNPAFGSPALPQWLRAHARPVLIALAAFGGVLATLELLVYVARVLPWRPTVAILAWVERFFSRSQWRPCASCSTSSSGTNWRNLCQPEMTDS